jgi:hypothetical protein
MAEGLTIKLGKAPEVWFEPNPMLAPGMEVLVKYLDPNTIERVQEQSKKKLNRQQRLAGGREDMDPDAYSRLLVREMIQDWRNFKIEYLQDMMPLADDTVMEAHEKHGGLVPFTIETLAAVSKNTYFGALVKPVQEFAQNLAAMRECERLVAEKNSDGSPAS